MSDEKTDADVAFIRALAAILKESDLGEIEVEREYGENDELMVRLSRTGPAQAAAPAPSPYTPVPAAASAASRPEPAPVPASTAPPDPADTPGMVPSPMVGTAYLSPEPGAPPFVAVGDTVTKGQTVIIIEAMKTMNQIPAPRDGTLRVMLVSDGDPVEFGMPLMVIE